MKLQHLRYLVAVVEYGGVIKAAERLHVSQPSVSAGLKSLEQELDGSLFDRSIPGNRPLRLTPAGQRFYQSALDILKRCDTARAAFAGEASGQTRIRLGVLDTLSHGMVAEVYRLLAQRDPDTRIELWEGSAERAAGWLAQGRVAFTWSNVSDLVPNARVLWRESLVAVFAGDHSLARLGGSLCIRDLARHPFVHRSRCELDPAGRALLKAAGVKLDVCIRAEHDDLAFRVIRNGNAITLAPQSLVPSDLASARVTDLVIERSIGLHWKEGTDQALLATVADTIHDAAQNFGLAWK